MDKQIWALDKFWIIWVSCLDRARTINEIQKIWNYDGNALYQKGLKEPIWKEMMKGGFLQSKGKAKFRGVYGDLLYGNFDWTLDFMKNLFSEIKLHQENPIPFNLLECLENKKKFVYFLDTNREIFYLPSRLKILFGNKDNLKNNCELSITAPMLTLYNQIIINALKKKIQIEADTIFLFSQSLIFTPYTRINFFGYYKEVLKDLSIKEIPEGIVNETKLFKLWKEYAHKILKALNL